MRIANWPALVCGWVLATLIGQTVLAADLDDELTDPAPGIEAGTGSGLIGGGRTAGRSGNPYQPVQYGEPGALGGYGPGAAPPADGAFGGAMPPTNAWPETSPFNQHRMEEVYNEGGLWSYDSDDNFTRTCYFTLDYLYGHGLRPGPHAFAPGNETGATLIPGTPGPFPLQRTGPNGIDENPFHNGILARAGYWNPDGSGALLSGFILFENSVNNLNRMAALQEGPGNVQTLASIVMDDRGTPVVIPFDTRFFTQYTQEIMGADADLYSAPFLTRPAFQLRMVYGVKYLRIFEQLYIQGEDSGLGYILDATTFAPTQPFIPVTFPYTSNVQSAVTTNLVGPTIGVRYDLGGKRLKFWGQSKFGVMANIQHQTISSSNLGHFKDGALPPAVVGGPDAFTVGPSTFHSSRSAHISPLFDQTFMMEFPFFSIVPYLNRFTILREGNVRIGWQFVAVGSVSRPANNINWILGDPSNNATRTWFEYNAFNFGMGWQW